jgi:fructose/tagatose bisphosphate aldolase
MPETSLNALLRAAAAGAYAVGYFESWSLESTRAVIHAAEGQASPVVIGFNGGILSDPKRVLGPVDQAVYLALWRRFAEQASVPVSVLVNEIPTLDMAQEAIALGANCLMVESDSSDLDDAISHVRSVVEAAHAAGVAVEANVGNLPSAASGVQQRTGFAGSLTRIDDARRFVGETGVDALGVSVGNVEVQREATAQLNLGLLEEIHRAVPLPLVLHGGSGIPDGIVPELVARGVCKINLGAALNTAFLSGMNSRLGSMPSGLSPKFTVGSGWEPDCLAAGELEMEKLVARKMAVYGSTGRVRAFGRKEDRDVR